MTSTYSIHQPAHFNSVAGKVMRAVVANVVARLLADRLLISRLACLSWLTIKSVDWRSMPRQRRHVSLTDGKSRRLGSVHWRNWLFYSSGLLLLHNQRHCLSPYLDLHLIRPGETPPLTRHPSLHSSHFEGILKYLGTPGGI